MILADLRETKRQPWQPSPEVPDTDPGPTGGPVR